MANERLAERAMAGMADIGGRKNRDVGVDAGISGQQGRALPAMTGRLATHATMPERDPAGKWRCSARAGAQALRAAWEPCAASLSVPVHVWAASLLERRARTGGLHQSARKRGIVSQQVKEGRHW